MTLVAPTVTQSVASNSPAGWIPPASVDGTRRWDYIMIHHSATEGGDAGLIDELHKERNFDGLGYQFVIDNGYFTHGRRGADGQVEVGYRWREQSHGAHCRVDSNDDNFWNEHAIGICLIGNFDNRRPTARQMDSAVKLVRFLMDRYHIPPSKVVPHRYAKATDCPGRYFPWDEFKRRLGRL